MDEDTKWLDYIDSSLKPDLKIKVKVERPNILKPHEETELVDQLKSCIDNMWKLYPCTFHMNSSRQLLRNHVKKNLVDIFNKNGNIKVDSNIGTFTFLSEKPFASRSGLNCELALDSIFQEDSTFRDMYQAYEKQFNRHTRVIVRNNEFRTSPEMIEKRKNIGDKINKIFIKRFENILFQNNHIRYACSLLFTMYICKKYHSKYIEKYNQMKQLCKKIYSLGGSKYKSFEYKGIKLDNININSLTLTKYQYLIDLLQSFDSSKQTNYYNRFINNLEHVNTDTHDPAKFRLLALVDDTEYMENDFN